MLVIAGSQMNKAGDSRDLSALKESSGIEESCDLALLIARTKDNAGHEIKDTDFTKNITLHIAKNRNGQTGEVKFRFTKEYCDFTEC
jgi:replicative DNA helicase